MSGMKERWYRFPLARWYRDTRDMTDAERGRYMDDTADALAHGLRGVTSLADFMQDDAEAARERRRAAWRAKKATGGTVEGGEA